MIELTYDELKQGLLCCTVYKDCTHCPLNEIRERESNCIYALTSAAMNCINTMERDFAEVSALADRWKNSAAVHDLAYIKLHGNADKK